MATFVPTGKPLDKLAWWSEVAAFWSIWWPSFLVVAGLILVAAVVFEGGVPAWLRVSLAETNLAAQILFIPRLVKKKYRAFRVMVERPDGVTNGRLSWGERLHVAVRLVGPQLAFDVLALSIFAKMSGHFDAEGFKSAGAMLNWARVLVVGPSSVSFAVRGNYRGFRLRAYRAVPSPS